MSRQPILDHLDHIPAARCDVAQSPAHLIEVGKLFLGNHGLLRGNAGDALSFLQQISTNYPKHFINDNHFRNDLVWNVVNDVGSHWNVLRVRAQRIQQLVIVRPCSIVCFSVQEAVCSPSQDGCVSQAVEKLALPSEPSGSICLDRLLPRFHSQVGRRKADCPSAKRRHPIGLASVLICIKDYLGENHPGSNTNSYTSKEVTVPSPKLLHTSPVSKLSVLGILA